MWAAGTRNGAAAHIPLLPAVTNITHLTQTGDSRQRLGAYSLAIQFKRDQ